MQNKSNLLYNFSFLSNIDKAYHIVSRICLFASVSALVSAYYAEYFLQLAPCKLCLYERVPFFVMLISSPFLLVTKNIRFYFMFIILSALFINILLSFFHFGVEQGIFKYQSLCTGYIGNPSSAQELMMIVKDAPIGNCSVPAIEILGLSLSIWNGLFCSFIFALIILILAYAYSNKIKKRVY
ncbi:DsbB superfamily disulfide bond formation protein [Candidatus Cyrtobacter comes]|uniref:DsbB superfamily disulfide bond formation protein n=1 Tax=Candidatus Cyrtobacter comes TaxID=675776 RepID=A0ABU5L7L9_9RICK|nr:disulfide bond formation protein B [Candidatus Cyrtobacter comes]MDZ5762118.1 DsbB superfamily disulfide bond formation protein [Candidatus Cyrtobacter comes]